MTSGCCFSVCSLLTDVRESVSDIPNNPDDIKTMLMEHLGLGKSATATAATGTPPASSTESVSIFKHPISYTDPNKLYKLESGIIDDLEMLETKTSDGSDGSDTIKGLYHYVFLPPRSMEPNTFRFGVNIILPISTI